MVVIKKSIENIQKTVGKLCIFAGLEFLLVMLYLETIIPGFDRSTNFISDLGVGNTALAFNLSIFFAGVLTVIVAVLIFKYFNKKLFGLFLFLSGISTTLVGVFPENWGLLHGIVSFTTFLLGGLVALLSSKYSKKPWKYLLALLGIITLVTLTIHMFLVYGLNTNTGLGDGTIERIIVYPFILWSIFFGSYLILTKEKFRK